MNWIPACYRNAASLSITRPETSRAFALNRFNLLPRVAETFQIVPAVRLWQFEYRRVDFLKTAEHLVRVFPITYFTAEALHPGGRLVHLRVTSPQFVFRFAGLQEITRARNPFGGLWANSPESPASARRISSRNSARNFGSSLRRRAKSSLGVGSGGAGSFSGVMACNKLRVSGVRLSKADESCHGSFLLFALSFSMRARSSGSTSLSVMGWSDDGGFLVEASGFDEWFLFAGLGLDEGSLVEGGEWFLVEG
jgi:hypothetical protein